MVKPRSKRYAIICGLISSFEVIISDNSGAGVVLDNSFGMPSGALTGPAYVVPASSGRRFDSNLFHSFQILDLADKESLTFTGLDSSITRVFARVTSGSPSTINGTIAVPGASFYLINSAGVTLGPTAKIDVTGSFCVTTADVLHLKGGGSFRALPDIIDDATLTTAGPAAFGFVSAAAPAGITIDKVGAKEAFLQVLGKPPTSLSLIGGNIKLKAAATVKTRTDAEARPARANFISLGSAGELEFDPEFAGSQPAGLETFASLGEVALTQSARIEVGSNKEGVAQSGRVIVRAANVTLSDSNIRSRSTSKAGLGVDLTIRGTLAMSGDSGIRSSTGGTADAATIQIKAGRLEMAGGQIRSEVDESATGNGGNIVIDADAIHLAPGVIPAEILTASLGGGPTADTNGRGGDVQITSRQPLDLENLTGQQTRIYTQAVRTGSAGSVRINAPGAETLDSNGVFSAAYATGSAGLVVLNGSVQKLPPSTISLDGTAGGSVQLLTRTEASSGVGGTFSIGTDAGAIDGSNLFYSFDQLTLNRQEALTFTGRSGDPITGTPVSGIRNVIARVGGGHPSSLNGPIRSSLDGATLFLLNPAGITFGPFSQLQVPGSLVVSSASAVHGVRGEKFGVGGGFAGAPFNGDVNGLDFAESPGPLSILGLPQTSNNPDKSATKLSVNNNAVMTLAGGDVFIDSRAISALGDLSLSQNGGAGRVNVLSLGSSGKVNFDPTSSAVPVEIFAKRLGAISLNDKAAVDASGVAFTDKNAASFGGRGGRIDIRAATLDLTRGAKVTATSSGGRANVGGLGIDIETTGKVTVSESQVASNGSNMSRAGDVVVNAAEIDLAGSGGDKLRAFELVSGDSFNMGISADAAGTADAGNVSIDTGVFSLRNGAKLASTTNGTGVGGNIGLLANRVSIDNEGSTTFTVISTQSNQPTSGAGGNIDIGGDGRLHSLDLLHGASILANTAGQGNGGTVKIRATGAVMLDGRESPLDSDGAGGFRLTSIDVASNAFAAPSLETSHGSGGTIQVEAGALNLLGFAQLKANTQTSGAGGNILVHAGAIDIDGMRTNQKTGEVLPSALTASSGRNTDKATLSKELTGDTIGNSGAIQVVAKKLSINNGGQIRTSTANEGKAGDINLRVAGRVTLQGGTPASPASIASRTSGSKDGTRGTGNGGNIKVAAGSVRLLDGASIVTDSGDNSDGASGTIKVGSKTSILLTNGAAINSQSVNSTAGDVSLSAVRNIDLRDTRIPLVESDRTEITSRGVTADGGNVNLHAFGRIRLNHAEVTTKGERAGGGISADPFLIDLKDGKIVADAVEKDAGNIDIRSTVIGFDPTLPSEARQNGLISAKSSRGISDTQLISPTESDIAGSLVRLPSPLPGDAAKLADLCGLRTAGNVSSFVTTGRGGSPLQPGGLAPSTPIKTSEQK